MVLIFFVFSFLSLRSLPILFLSASRVADTRFINGGYHFRDYNLALGSSSTPVPVVVGSGGRGGGLLQGLLAHRALRRSRWTIARSRIAPLGSPVTLILLLLYTLIYLSSRTYIPPCLWIGMHTTSGHNRTARSYKPHRHIEQFCNADLNNR